MGLKCDHISAVCSGFFFSASIGLFVIAKQAEREKVPGYGGRKDPMGFFLIAGLMGMFCLISMVCLVTSIKGRLRTEGDIAEQERQGLVADGAGGGRWECPVRMFRPATSIRKCLVTDIFLFLCGGFIAGAGICGFLAYTHEFDSDDTGRPSHSEDKFLDALIGLLISAIVSGVMGTIYGNCAKVTQGMDIRP